jgi:hypothetical protein
MHGFIDAFGWGAVKVFGVGSLVCSSASTAFMVAMQGPLSKGDLDRLQTGDAQAVLAIMLGLFCLGMVALAAVVCHLYKSTQKMMVKFDTDKTALVAGFQARLDSMAELARTERDRREDMYHAQVERMINFVREAAEASKASTRILENVGSIVQKCHDDTVVLKSAPLCKMHKLQAGGSGEGRQ